MINITRFVYIGTLSASLGACTASPSQSEESLSVKPAVASPPPTPSFVWVSQGEHDQVVARLVTPQSRCPPLKANGVDVATGPRAAHQPLPAFPVTVCEAVLPVGTKTASWDGQDLAVPKAEPRRIAFFGDTGCRIKQAGGKSLVQNCNDAEAWPLAKVAQQMAAKKPDLVIHVGDYHYRESPCPEGDSRCAGALVGDTWASWQQDFFAPVAPLLKVAPMIFVRGNHELCKRSGLGWRRLLDPRPYQDRCSDAPAPYVVKAGDHRIAVLDSADDANMTASFNQLQPYPQGYVWWVLHRPFLTPGTYGDAKQHAELPAAFRRPGALGAVFAGHKHMVALTAFAGSLPPELITGNGGSSLEAETSAGQASELFVAGGVTTRRTNTFGFLTLDRQDGPDASWLVTEWDVNGQELFRCTLKEAHNHQTVLNCPKPTTP